MIQFGLFSKSISKVTINLTFCDNILVYCTIINAFVLNFIQFFLQNLLQNIFKIFYFPI